VLDGPGGHRLRPWLRRGKVFYLGLALDSAYVEGFVEGDLERIGEDDEAYEDLLRTSWEEGGEGLRARDAQGRVRGSTG
jgi:hypothetical protein